MVYSVAGTLAINGINIRRGRALACRYYGRDSTGDEMALLRTLIAGPERLSRHVLSKLGERRRIKRNVMDNRASFSTR